MDVVRNGYSFLPAHWTFDAYRTIFINTKQLVRSYYVTILSTLVGTALGMWLIVTSSYVLTRRDYKYRNILSFYIFFTMLFNGGLVPSYLLIAKWLGMKNTLMALIVPYLFNAFYVLLLKGFFQAAIPDSLYESAKIDGANELTILMKIVIPLSTPALATVALFYVLQYWNDWFLSLMYTSDNSLLKLQTLLIRVLKNLEFLNSAEARQYMWIDKTQVPSLTARMAMCIVAAGPMIVVFPFFQKYFIKGLKVGAIKG